MSLCCIFKNCTNIIASHDQLAFFQDRLGGWNLGLAPDIESTSTIRILKNQKAPCPPKVVFCVQCSCEIGGVFIINGFEGKSVNFSAKKVGISQDPHHVAPKPAEKWSKIMTQFPAIRRITSSTPVAPIRSKTVHFQGVSDFEEITKAITKNATPSDIINSLQPHHWRSVFFACLNNALLFLPAGMGKTLIAALLMKAYRQLNPEQGQVFVVPTAAMVNKKADDIERYSGLKIIRRTYIEAKTDESGLSEMCVITIAVLNEAIRLKLINVSQLSLMILDKIQGENNFQAECIKLGSSFIDCSASQRPRFLALAIPPSNDKAIMLTEKVIKTMFAQLKTLPFSPLADIDIEGPTVASITYIEVKSSPIEQIIEKIIFENIENAFKIHPFFYNQRILQSLSIKKKLESIMIILNQSLNFSKTVNDIELQQMINFMNGWIELFEVLRVSGPKKIIDRMRSDLGIIRSNRNMSRILPKIRPLLNEIESKITLVLNQSLPADSTPVGKLLEILKNHKSNKVRILIFVDYVNTAEKLCWRLRCSPDLNDMNPSFLSGFAANGDSIGPQRNVIEKFRSKQSRILVAASDLQRHDIVMCDIVVCFDDITSVKSIVEQVDPAKLIVFTEKKIYSETDKIAEFSIPKLMVQFNSRFRDDFKEEMEKFFNKDEIMSQAVEKIDTKTESPQHFSDDEMLILKFFNYMNSYAIADMIEAEFRSPFDEIIFRKKLITAKFAVAEVKAKFYESKIIRNISTTPVNRNGQHRHPPTWMEVVYPNISPSSDCNNCPDIFLIFDYLSTFYFQDSLTVALDRRNMADRDVKFKIKNSEIVIRVKEDFFVIKPLDVGDQILICETHKSFEIFLCLKNPPRFFSGNERAPFDFSNKTFHIYLRSNKPIEQKDSLKIRRALEFFSSHVHNVCNLKLVDMSQEPTLKFSDFAKTYLINVWHSKHAAVLPPAIPNQLLKRLHQIPTANALEVLLNNFVPEMFEPLRMPDLRNVELPFPDLLPENYVRIGRIKVTPSRIFFKPMKPIPKNRIYRYFPNPENFFVVQFVDEHDRNPWRNHKITELFKDIMFRGIEFAGKEFKFLGCSNSQLREGQCWFSCIPAKIIYEKIGTFPDNWSAGRKLTRIALAFASSIETIPLDHGRYLRNVNPDIMNNSGTCFSDGIGRASKAVIKKILKTLNLPDGTSAFQIRVGGIKGVITGFDQESDVTFRYSMKKFDSEHNVLEVLNFSQSLKMTLNRHVILLLSSFGVPDEVFLEMQFNELEKIIEALTDDRKSLSFVKSQLSAFDWEIVNPTDSTLIVHEPFFRQILISNTISLVSSIIDHAHIPVEQGRLLMGVLDETQQLQYGEVYAHIEDADIDMEINGKVIVFRNPCVLPSDIRVLNARTCLSDQFKSLYRNCLVFPSCGPAATTQECSGGDLDGDLYYIVWDERLVPAKLEAPGTDVIEVETLQIHQTLKGHSYRNLIEFYCDYQENNQLGIIANAHLATADKHGFSDPKSVELARYVTAETDAPKKGYTVGRMRNELTPQEYPDYMQKGDKLSYRSETILGKLFRQANPILEVLLEKNPPTILHTLLTYHKDESSLECLYELYCFEVKKILESFELQFEVDLFSGAPQWKRGYATTYKQKTDSREHLMEVVALFWRKWNNKFEDFRMMVKNDQEKIIEWYEFPISQGSPNEDISPMHSFSFLALPHVRNDRKIHQTIRDSIGETTAAWVNSNKMTWLTEWTQRAKIGRKLISTLEKIPSQLYGSSFLSLSKDDSEIDLFAFGDLRKMKAVFETLDKDADFREEPHAGVTLFCDSYAVDVTNNFDRVRKTNDLAEVFDHNPTLWPALRVILEWARTVKVVTSNGADEAISIMSLCSMFIRFATSSTPKIENSSKPYTIKRLDSWMESVNSGSCGNLIFDFFKKLVGSRSNEEWITLSVDQLTHEPLEREKLVDELRKNAEVALYILVVHDGNIEKLFQFCTKKRLFKISSEYMDPKDITEEAEQQRLRAIENICNLGNCEGLTYELLVRNGSYYIEVSGDHKKFPEVELGLSQIYNKMVYKKMYGQSKSFGYYLNRSTSIIIENGKGPDTEVKFRSYDSHSFHSHHLASVKTTLELRNKNFNPKWRTTEFIRYRERFLEQLQNYKSNQKRAENETCLGQFLGDMKCQIRIGEHYFLYAPPELINTTNFTNLNRVERETADQERAIDSKKAMNIARDYQMNHELALTRRPNSEASKIILRPLKESKIRAINQQEYEKHKKDAKKNNQKHFKMRHSFYTCWTFGVEKTEMFAAENMFEATEAASYDYHISISLTWRSRDRNMRCDREGRIQDIMNRKTRWVTTTFKRADSRNGPDLRSYLETQKFLDKDESCLKTFVQLRENSSIFTEEFINEIKLNSFSSKKPLISDIFKYNWQFYSLRVHTPVAKFVNSLGDVLIQNVINDGIFMDENFEWSTSHHELEIRLKIEGSTDEELCQRSYDLCLKLFDFTKTQN